MFSFLWDKCPGVQLLGPEVGLCLIIFKVLAVPFYVLNSSVCDPVSAPFLPGFGVVTGFVLKKTLKIFGHSDRCGVLSHCGFNLHFPDA